MWTWFQDQKPQWGIITPLQLTLAFLSISFMKTSDIRWWELPLSKMRNWQTLPNDDGHARFKELKMNANAHFSCEKARRIQVAPANREVRLKPPDWLIQREAEGARDGRKRGRNADWEKWPGYLFQFSVVIESTSGTTDGGKLHLVSLSSNCTSVCREMTQSVLQEIWKPAPLLLVGRGEALNTPQISRLPGRYFKLKDSFNWRYTYEWGYSILVRWKNKITQDYCFMQNILMVLELAWQYSSV